MIYRHALAFGIILVANGNFISSACAYGCLGVITLKILLIQAHKDDAD